MDDKTKNLIKEQYAKLPPVLQKAIQSTDLHDQITAIGTKHQLHIDQMGLLEDEISLLMMGFTEPIEFAGALQENVHVTADQAQKIAADINQEILLPIRDRLENNTTPAEAPSVITDPPAMSAAPAAPHAPEKSVVMPSSVAAASKAPAPAPSPIPQAAPAAVAPLSNQIAPAHEADIMLSQPTISMPKKVETTPSISSGQAATPVSVAPAPATPAAAAKVEPPKPAPIYKADPYREPIE